METKNLLADCLKRKNLERVDYFIFPRNEYGLTEYDQLSKLVRAWANAKTLGGDGGYHSGHFFEIENKKRKDYFYVSWSKKGRADFVAEINKRAGGVVI